MGTKAERRAARELVAAYHQDRLSELVDRVAEAIEGHRVGELGAFEVDEVIHHYTRAARKLWTFCQTTGAQAETTAHIITRMNDRGEVIDWWQQAVPRRR